MNGDEELLDELERVANEGAEAISRRGRPNDATQPQRDDPLIVTINTPHTVAVHGNSVALNIKAGTPDATSGTASDRPLGPIVLTLSKNGIPTDYNINGEEA